MPELKEIRMPRQETVHSVQPHPEGGQIITFDSGKAIIWLEPCHLPDGELKVGDRFILPPEPML